MSTDENNSKTLRAAEYVFEKKKKRYTFSNKNEYV